jgi:hypothetical protein
VCAAQAAGASAVKDQNQPLASARANGDGKGARCHQGAAFT